jgi:hypothetical protein
VGCRRPKRCRRAIGNQAVYALLPHAKTGHLTHQQGTSSRVTDLPRKRFEGCEDQSLNRLTLLHEFAVAGSGTFISTDLNSKSFDTLSNTLPSLSLSVCGRRV